MAKKVIINGVVYDNVPYVNIPLSEGGGSAKFVDTDSGDAVSGDIRNGKKVWVDGNEVTGNIPEKGASDVTVSGKTVTIPVGIYDEQVQKSVADGVPSVSGSISGDEIGTTTSDYPVEFTPTLNMTTPGYVSGTVSGQKQTKYIQVEDKTVTPKTTAQTITPTSGKLMKKVSVGAVDVSGTATEADVLNGKTFFSGGSLTRKTGSATVPTIGQDSTTKALTIS